MKREIAWLSEPDKHDYPAAESYLSLLYSDAMVGVLVELLKDSPPSSFKAKDIVRASGLPLLGKDNFHVKADREKIKAGKPLSPVLLVRSTIGRALVIADGYHRVCAVYSLDEDASIPCRIAPSVRGLQND